MAMTAKELRDEAIDDEGVAATSMGMAKLTWAAIVRLKRGWADALDEIARLRETLRLSVVDAANEEARANDAEATLASVRAKLDALPPDPPRYPYTKARCVEIIREARALCDGPEGGSDAD